MKEYNYEKNAGIDLDSITIGTHKKYGGNALWAMSGKMKSTAEIEEPDVHIVRIIRHGPAIMILQQ